MKKKKLEAKEMPISIDLGLSYAVYSMTEQRKSVQGYVVHSVQLFAKIQITRLRIMPFAEKYSCTALDTG